MAKITVEKCPESGICSILKENGPKVDLMPDESEQLKNAAGDASKARVIIEQADSSFAKNLTTEELNDILAELS